MTTVENHRRDAQAIPADTPVAASPTLPVQVWGTVGGLVLVFIVVIWSKWITGPSFRSVSGGPSRQPAWMHDLQLVWQPLFAAVAIAFLYWFLVRPWRRDGRASTDGLLCAAYGLLYFQDPLSSFTGHWFTYNTYLWNMGSWVNEIPGWMAFGKPGANVAEPLVFTSAVYVWAFFGMTLLGSFVMRRAAARWPRLGTPSLIAICFVSLFLADIVLEGFIWLRLGFLAYPGGHWNLFADTWHQYPLHEGITAGALFTGLAALRHFRNDQGETFADRGVERLQLSGGPKTLLRFLAFVGASQVIMMGTYNIPVATLIASHPARWPASIQSRSYLNDHVCGAGTDRLCPQPGLPTIGAGEAEVGPAGRLVVPQGVTLPRSYVPLTQTGASDAGRR
jgi:Spirocyclase AveC-like